MMRMRSRTVIPSSFLVRALASKGRRYHCRNCGDQMFVKYESELCPLCFNGRRPMNQLGTILEGGVREVPDGMALAGVLDDPTIDELVDGLGD